MEEPDAAQRRKRRVTAHFILDAGPEAKPDALSATARQFLAERFGKDGHEYFLVRHDDTKQPHVHVVLNLMNGQGKRLRTSVVEVQRWREHFAETARKNGIDVDATRAWERGKSPTRSRGLVRYGAPKPARWTREQVRRGIAARRQRLLSDAALATASGEQGRAEALKAKAAALRVHSDDSFVRHVAEERRGRIPVMSWDTARARNARSVAQDFRRQADGLEIDARNGQDRQQTSLLQRAAIQLRKFAGEVQRAPTRSQMIAAQAQRVRGHGAAVDPERDPQAGLNE
jgi:hypothetical protein